MEQVGVGCERGRWGTREASVKKKRKFTEDPNNTSRCVVWAVDVTEVDTGEVGSEGIGSGSDISCGHLACECMMWEVSGIVSGGGHCHWWCH